MSESWEYEIGDSSTSSSSESVDTTLVDVDTTVVTTGDLSTAEVAQEVAEASTAQEVSVSVTGESTVNSLSADVLTTDIFSGAHLSITEQVNAVAGGTAEFCGFSDAATNVICLACNNSAAGGNRLFALYKISYDFGVCPYLASTTNETTAVTAAMLGAVIIGTDRFWSRDADTVRKNNSDMTISGGASPHDGLLAHDPTNSYMLIMTSSTNIKRYSGISGTTLTFVDTITLDTAVSTTTGFLYDDTNQRFICIDTTNSVLRRFNNTGKTVDTVAYTVDTTKIKGLVFLNHRIYMVALESSSSASGAGGTQSASMVADFIPTNMVREGI